MLLLPSRRNMSVLLKQFNEPKKTPAGRYLPFRGSLLFMTQYKGSFSYRQELQIQASLYLTLNCDGVIPTVDLKVRLKLLLSLKPILSTISPIL